MGVYDFTVKTSQGKEKSLADYKGKVLVIVNTASKCGFTPQFKGLQDLYMKYKGQGLEILGFPCNQFAEQDPEGNAAIEQGDVRGETAQPLFKFLTKEKGFEGFDMNHPIAGKLEEALKANFPEYLEGDGIKWNFTKFLIDREGNVVKRFEPTAAPEDMEKDIEALL